MYLPTRDKSPLLRATSPVSPNPNNSPEGRLTSINEPEPLHIPCDNLKIPTLPNSQPHRSRVPQTSSPHPRPRIPNPPPRPPARKTLALKPQPVANKTPPRSEDPAPDRRARRVPSALALVLALLARALADVLGGPRGCWRGGGAGFDFEVLALCLVWVLLARVSKFRS